MKIKESFNILDYTILEFEETEPNQLFLSGSAVIIDGVKYERLRAFDIGARIAIKGSHDFVGKEAEIVK